MKTKWLIPAFLLTFICCENCLLITKAIGQASAKPNKIAKKVTLKEPNITALRQRLFTYIDRNNTDAVHDTADHTYATYWGPAFYPPYMVKVGHLLNSDQLHAVMFFADEKGAGMRVFLWKENKWNRIYTNDHLGSGECIMPPEFKDWNRDGRKDIAVGWRDCASSVEWTSISIIITDKTGEKMHYVEGLDDVRYPKLDKKTGHIFSTLFKNYCYVHTDYAIRNYKVSTITEIAAVDNPLAKVRDSTCEISWRINGKEVRSIYTSYEHITEYVPAELKAEFGKWAGMFTSN